MKHYIITNREILGKYPNEKIRRDGRENAGDNLRFGTYDLESKKIELYPEPKQEADLIYSNKSSRLVGSNRFFHELYSGMSDSKGDTLVFIHGFNNNMDDVEKSIHKLHETYVVPKESPIQQLIMVTWPSRSPDVPYHYHDDQEDARRSGKAFGRAMEKLIGVTCFSWGLGRLSE